MNKKTQGFTLIELLIVITIITGLAVAVFVALNPAQRLKDARNARRTTDVDSILTAIHEYIVDNKSTLPPGLSASMPITQIGTGSSGCDIASGPCSGTAASCINLSDPTTNLGKYLKTVPKDPLNGTDTATRYAVDINANGLVTITSCSAEGATVQAAR
jgi:prepilin-type N-terminal cleavage/methylation domain-containing protein